MLLMPYSKAIEPMDKDLINFWQALVKHIEEY
jgi:hypothetical protein